MATEPEIVTGAAALDRLEPDLGPLARRAGSPFLTVEWLRAWWEAFGAGRPSLVTIRRDGEVVAGAFVRRHGPVLSSTANDHTGDGEVLAADEEAREAAWRTLARLRALRLHVVAVPEHGGAAAGEAALAAAGYRVVRERGPLSPFLALPDRADDLLATASRNLRSQVGRRRRALEREGQLVLRTSRSEDEVRRDLDAFLTLEASGWKGRGGTAITADAATERLYREVAAAGARAGWARLHLLELDGVPLAADLEAVLGGTAFLIKTGYDEAWSRLSPGLVLRAAVLRNAVEEGCTGYDFLGGPDAYKTRWTGDVRARVRLSAYRDPPGHWYRAVARPALKRLRDRRTAA